MDEKTVLCPSCCTKVPYTIVTETMNSTLKNKSYTYVGQKAYCNKCGEEVFMGSIHKNNLTSLYTTYREENDIISLEEIRSIPKKYNIGKRPLSLLLGWGEVTFTRYYNGDMPTKQYSNILKHLLQDTQYYSTLLEKNKSNLNSEKSYTKSKAAVKALLSKPARPTSKIFLAAAYIIHSCADTTPLALQKALYYTQGFYCAFYQEFFFAEDCEAWPQGPVYSLVHETYEDYIFDPTQTCSTFDTTVFTTGEISILDSVIKHLCCYSGEILEQFTCSEQPWLTAKRHLDSCQPSLNTISKESIKEYFMDIKAKMQLINPKDIREYAEAMFKQRLVR